MTGGVLIVLAAMAGAVVSALAFVLIEGAWRKRP